MILTDVGSILHSGIELGPYISRLLTRSPQGENSLLDNILAS